MIDPHHCHCFGLHSSYHNLFKQQLIGLGFGEPLLQENHGQKFGLTKRLDDETQIHVKVLESGTIEGEIEYPPVYPLAHLNQEYSYSAHDEIDQILRHTSVAHTRKVYPPLTCIQRIIKKAVKPTHAKVIVGAVVGIAVIGALAYTLAKSKN